jgi:DNA primase
MRTAVDQIKEKLSIVEVVSTYVKLEKAGSNLKGKCPFHNEKTPSFFISPERNTYYCFGCGEKGDIFSFVENFEKVDFKGALKILAEKAGVKLNDFNPKAEEERDMLFRVVESATKYFEERLENTEDPKKYLINRGLTSETIKEWRLGYAEEQWNELNNHLQKEGYSISLIEKAGLIKRGEKGSFYDRFRGRIIFPIFDPSGRPVGFTGRIYSDVKPLNESEDLTPAKYLNSPDSILFNKSEIIYGYHKAKNSIRSKGYSLLVEGQMDLLMCHQIGINNAIATSGTALTEGQLQIIKRSSSNLMIAYDGDKAGISASKRAFALAIKLGFEVKIAMMAKDSDPADFIKKDQEGFKKALKESLHVIDFTLQSVLNLNLDERSLLKKINEEVIPLIIATPSPVERSYFISKIAEKIKVPEAALYEQLSITKNEPEVKSTFISDVRKTSERDKRNILERKIAGIYFKSSENLKDVINKSFQRLFEDVPSFSLDSLVSPYEQDREMLIFEAEKEQLEDNENEISLKRYFEDLAKSLKKEILKTELQIITDDLKKAEKDKDQARARELLKQVDQLTKKLSYLKI